MIHTFMALLALAAPPTTPAAEAGHPKEKEDVVEEVVAWVNDDVVLWSDLRDTEQQGIAKLLEKKMPPEELAQRVGEVRTQTLMQLISNRLLVQEAERLYNVEEIKKDMVKRFKERQRVKTDEELDQILVQMGISRSELEDRLLQGSAPDYVVDMQVRRNLGVSEAEMRAQYEQQKAQLTAPAQVTFREIVLLDQKADRRAARKELADKIVAEARGGADFAELVKNYSEAPSKAVGGRIGPVRPDDLVGPIAKATMALAVGGVSDPIETAQGWHIIKLEERKDAHAPTFEEVRNDMENAVREAKFGPALDEFLKQLWTGATIEVRKDYLDRIPPAFRSSVKARD